MPFQINDDEYVQILNGLTPAANSVVTEIGFGTHQLGVAEGEAESEYRGAGGRSRTRPWQRPTDRGVPSTVVNVADMQNRYLIHSQLDSSRNRDGIDLAPVETADTTETNGAKP